MEEYVGTAEYLTTMEVAGLLRLSQETVARMCADGRLTAVKPNGRRGGWRIPRAEAARWLRGEVLIKEVLLQEERGA